MAKKKEEEKSSDSPVPQDTVVQDRTYVLREMGRRSSLHLFRLKDRRNFLCVPIPAALLYPSIRKCTCGSRERCINSPNFVLPSGGGCGFGSQRWRGRGGEISLAQDANWSRNFCTKEGIKGSMIEVSPAQIIQFALHVVLVYVLCF